MDGKTVGVVTMRKSRPVMSTSRLVSIRVSEVPSNVHAGLQQATVLGDNLCGSHPSPTDKWAVPPISPGGRVSLANTTSPPQLEDTIANLATFVSERFNQRVQRRHYQCQSGDNRRGIRPAPLPAGGRRSRRLVE